MSSTTIPRVEMPWKTFFFFRNSLSGIRLEAYKQIRRGIAEWSKRIQVPGGIQLDEMYQIYQFVIRDSTFFFHVTNAMSLYYGDTVSYVEPEYHLTPEEYEPIANQVKQFAYNARRLTINQNSYEKVRILHVSMVKHIVYQNRDDPDDHNILGAILQRKSVCEGISKAFKLLCDFCMVPCIVISGTTNSDEDWLTRKNTTHAWNMVQLDNRWFHVDVTFDTTISNYPETGLVCYDYFLRSDHMISVNHRAMTEPRPRSTLDFSIYRAAGLYARTPAEAAAIIRQLGKEKKAFTFEYDPCVRDATAFVNEASAQANIHSFSYSIKKEYRTITVYL